MHAHSESLLRGIWNKDTRDHGYEVGESMRGYALAQPQQRKEGRRRTKKILELRTLAYFSHPNSPHPHCKVAIQLRNEGKNHG
jgi:hypothetical protein